MNESGPLPVAQKGDKHRKRVKIVKLLRPALGVVVLLFIIIPHVSSFSCST